ncbi:hypothetical protein ACIBIZ_10005 [Nonomuraea spiralis]|uniref:hypothetical protein n=1 Tax=Nonomuraea TaxID=83681 RepID=UPI001C8C8FA8|nr:hypothetical protein [Nonomuraea sp. WAC 01424]
MTIVTVGRVTGRTAWALLAAFFLAFLVFEVVKHGGATPVSSVLFVVLPYATRFGGPAVVHDLAHRPWIPLAVLVGYSVSSLNWVPVFTAGLAWMTYVAVARVLGHGPRSARG